MRLVHHRDGEAAPSAGEVETRILADDVERAEGPVAQSLGLMFRPSIPEGYALVFPFAEPADRTIHTLFVFEPLDVLWLVDDEVIKVDRLRPFRGLTHGLADTVIELRAGGADGVEPGDTVVLEN
ncbi:DUF192 domain-containing protein [Halolamina sp. CBA1230]|uniref:DUF192 domain-containing protein n=1 Tax=Halolamina sp. CBA1230 TaxID=1853690 RepID=UPI0009A25146|nr:DUF192 domain-containing protein [Halolamina sp. CBA1230]QKY20614.1 DUF192 domain-containing protein [Halolamina sp. CBA1230]